MINLKLRVEDYLEVTYLMINEINLNNYDSSIKENMETLIKSFNTEYNWDLMYKINDVEDRMRIGHKLFILYFKEEPIGYVWYKKTDENTMHLYNLYVTKKTKRPKLSPKWFINICNGIVFKECTNITCECEEWNKSAQSVFYSNGFISFD